MIVAVIILLLTKNEQRIINQVTVELDTTYMMTELRKLQFEARKDSIVYVTQSDVTQFETVREPIVYYYSDTVRIVQNNEVPVVANLTKDTIVTKDGHFYATILSQGAVYNNELTYQLNVPQITKTVTRNIEPRSRLMLSGALSGHNNKFGVSSGLIWQHSQGYGVQYQYDVINRTHVIGGFYPIIEFKKQN